MVLSGAGWDVVPSDCLALHTARRVADPERAGPLECAPAAMGELITGWHSTGIGDIGEQRDICEEQGDCDAIRVVDQIAAAPVLASPTLLQRLAPSPERRWPPGACR
jgi:hypothetical protein